MDPNTTSRMCLECTILDQIGDAHSTFQNFLFTSDCISVYVPCSKSNIVICELEDACTEGYELFGFPLSQTQPNAPYLSQSDRMGYGSVPAAGQMGSQPFSAPASVGTDGVWLRARCQPNGIWTVRTIIGPPNFYVRP